MRLLLTTLNSKYIHQNLAIGLMYELYRTEYEIEAKEFTIKAPIDEIAQYCSQFEVAAFSCYIWNITQTIKVAQAVKQLNPQCQILLGGPEVSYEWQDVIALPQVDYIIAHEGEVPLRQFLKNYPQLEQVSGLVWKNHGEVVVNQPASLFNLEEYAQINPYNLIPTEELRHKVCYVEATRGCPHRCAYCLAGLDNKIRYLPKEHVEQNLLYLMEHGRVIKFLDRTFNANPAYAIGIFEFILQHHKPDNIFQFEIKADVLQPQLIEFIRTSVPKGLFRFEIGIQTLNAQSNKEVKRRQDFENIKHFVKQVEDVVELHLDLIVGLPYDYFEDIKYSFEQVFRLFAPELQLGFLKFLKGTPIRTEHRKHGYKFQPQAPYQILESNYLSVLELQRIEVVEHALEIYWNKKRACHTLRYVADTYSIFDFLEGLGNQWENIRKKNMLLEMYEALRLYAATHYPSDGLLMDLITLDYNLQHKIKPKARIAPEVTAEQRNRIVEERGLNHHQFRYAIHPVGFNVKTLMQQGQLVPQSDMLIIQFSGTQPPEVIC